MVSRRVGLAGLLATALASAGCAADPPITSFSFVTTEPGVLMTRVIRPSVRGKACFTRDFVTAILTPPWQAKRANHGRAVSDALDRVPGADVLLDASLRVEIRQYLLFSRVCAVATGDAGEIQ